MFQHEESYSDTLSYSQWQAEAVRQYAGDHGRDRPDLAYILSPYDTWETNPFYVGPRQPHPESDEPPVDLTFKQAATMAKALAMAQLRPVRLGRYGGEGYFVEIE